MGPDSTSSRERLFLGAAAVLPDRFLDVAFFEDFFFDAFLPAGLPAADFFRGAFFGAAFFGAAFLAFFLLAPLREADFFAAFLPPVWLRAFLATFFFADLRAAGLRRAADFFFDTFLVEAFLVLLTLRFFPEVFLPPPALREDARALAATERFRFLLAAFLAGMIDSCRSEKNAELYIG